MTALTRLDEILAALDVVARPDQYVVATLDGVQTDLITRARAASAATIEEAEGLTVVLRRADADALGIPSAYVAAWLTLTVRSSLEAVGLTARFASALAASGISCNVLAGYHHDHILVDARDRDRALAVLRGLRTR